MIRPDNFPPDFRNIELILQRQKPYRYTPYEFFWSDTLSARIVGIDKYPEYHTREDIRVKVEASYRLGYDYAGIHGSPFCFPATDAPKLRTRSLNDAGGIVDWQSFKSYDFKDPNLSDYSRLLWGNEYLKPGMKFIVHGPLGVLENVVALTGYENLCFMLFDEPRLVATLFAEVGERLVVYFENCLKYESVGAILVNDDWGFNTQTMISPADLRRYVFPYHKKIVAAAHNAGKYAILHSCGNRKEIYADIIKGMKYDACHSFEDSIQPVEQAYNELSGDIAVMGGIDVDYLVQKSPVEVFRRARSLLEQTECKGYALGTGNSVPDYIPYSNYIAMLSALWSEVFMGGELND